MDKTHYERRSHEQGNYEITPTYKGVATYNVLLTIGENSLSIPISMRSQEGETYCVGTIQGSIELNNGNTISISNLPLVYENPANVNGISIDGIMNNYPYGSGNWSTGSGDVVVGNTYSATYNKSVSNISVTKLIFSMTNKADEDEWTPDTKTVLYVLNIEQ